MLLLGGPRDALESLKLLTLVKILGRVDAEDDLLPSDPVENFLVRVCHWEALEPVELTDKHKRLL
jgi:hypothetical protein